LRLIEIYVRANDILNRPMAKFYGDPKRSLLTLTLIRRCGEKRTSESIFQNQNFVISRNYWTAFDKRDTIRASMAKCETLSLWHFFLQGYRNCSSITRKIRKFLDLTKTISWSAWQITSRYSKFDFERLLTKSVIRDIVGLRPTRKSKSWLSRGINDLRCMYYKYTRIDHLFPNRIIFIKFLSYNF